MPNRDFLVDQPGRRDKAGSVPLKTGRLANLSVYNVKKVTFSVKCLQSFCRRQKQHYCRDLVLGWAVLQMPVFNHY